MEGEEAKRDEEIRQLAYRLWQEEGCPNGCDVEHWLRAQMIWEEMKRPKNKPVSRGRPKGTRKTNESEL